MKIIKDKLIVGNFISNLFYSLGYPTVHYILISNINEKMISLNSILLCISGIILPIVWNKYSDKLYEKYGYLLSIEAILYTLLTILIIIGFIDNKAYYFIDTILFALVTKNIICGNNRLTSMRYKNKDREIFDNSIVSVSNMSSLIGFGISFVFTIPVNIAFIFMGLGIVADNIFYYRAYKECKNKI